jgi:hypothetical protein
MRITGRRGPLLRREIALISTSDGKQSHRNETKKQEMTMSTFIRSAIVALALVGSVSAVSAAPAGHSDAKSFFEQLQRTGS